MRFVKGHGTENDFIILPDPDGALDLTPELVARLCDRRAGLGADGVLRAVRSAASPEAAFLAGEAAWFMDYRNADGSLAEMCGNGIRVFARYLVDAGYVVPGRLAIATRAGVRHVTVEDFGEISVEMGMPQVTGPAQVSVAGRCFAGIGVSLGNPHLACVVGEPLDDIDLSRPPLVDSREFPTGVNVELVRPLRDHEVQMRVHERGSGETRSCGTGAVAAAVAVARAAGEAPGTWRVGVPGGWLTVVLDRQGSVLRGPAVLVAEGELRLPEILSGVSEPVNPW